MIGQDLPPGFALDEKPPAKRTDPRKAARKDADPGRLPPGFKLDLSPTGAVHDGDTYRTRGGPNARLFGVDAPELDQPGYDLTGNAYPLGTRAREAFVPMAQPGAVATGTGASTLGRPVVTLANGAQDAGREMVARGLAFPEPRFLADDPRRLADYVAAQRGAIAAERGAYSGTYQQPGDYRQQGDAARVVGKIAMTPEDAGQWDAMMHDPQTKQADVEAWLAARGHSAENVGNIMSFLRRNPQAAFSPYYQQRDAQGAPVQHAQPFLTRQGAAFAEGVPDVLGLPAEAVRANPDVLGPTVPVLDLASILIGGKTKWEREHPARAPAPEFSVKGRAAEGTPLANEVGMFGDEAAMHGPKTGYRFTPEQEAEIARATSDGDAGQVIALTERFSGGKLTPDREALAATIAYARKHPGWAVKQNYSGVDRAAEEANQPPKETQTLGGTEMFRGLMHSGGVGQLDESYAPQSASERYLQSFERSLPSAVIPIAGEAGMAGRIGREVIATGVAGSAGAYAGGQAADDIAPGNQLANFAGQLVGGGIGGLGARRLASPRESIVHVNDGRATPGEVPPIPSTPEPPPDPASVAPQAIHIDGPALRARAADASGAVDIAKAGADLRDAADAGLARGDAVTLHVDGRAVPITRPGLVDAAGQQWGAMPILTAKEGSPNRLEIAPRAAAMASEDRPAVLHGPDLEAPGIERPQPLSDGPSDAARQQAAQAVNPRDLLPVPASRLADVTEAANIEAGRYAPVKAGDENAELSSRGLPSPRAASQTIRKRGPVDLVQWVRSQGGLKPQGGELAHYGITNAPRKGMDFAKGEQRLGKLVDPENGMTFDDAAMRAWEAGYFPDHAERPLPAEFLDALNDTHTGRNRVFHPDDFEEVDRFNAARDRRYAVEAADQEGAPLAVDRSQPATMEDLDANSAPVEAYSEWGENAPDFAGNVRLEHLDSPQSIKRALVQVERINGGFDAATRGRITHAETKSLAADLNMTAAQLLARRKGEALNAEQALAARQILAKSGNELVNMARRMSAKIEAGEASDADMVAFRAALVRHAAIQEQVSGATAEAGRALSQFRVAGDARAVRGEVLKGLVDQSGGADGIRDAARIIVENADDPKRLNNAARALAKPTLKDKALELWYNSLLSGPRTHAVNITSNFMTALLQIPEHAGAAVIGAPKRVLFGKSADRVLLSEPGARAVGLMQGAKEGLAQFVRTLRTGETSDFGSKVETERQRALNGPLGSVLRLPTRLLEAEDEFFKAAARRSDLVGLSVREASKEGLSGKAARERAAELAANPTPEMIEHAADYGRYVTFQRPLGKVGKGVMAFANSHPAFKLFIPFVRTPANLLKFAVERSPAAPMLSEWRADMKAGGARRDLAIARVSMGSGAMMLAAKAAQQGLITGGGPADESARRLMLADGWQPYSVKVGDRYLSYQRLDPLSTTLGISADLVDLQKHMTDAERDKVASLLVASTLQNLGNKTWLQGMSDIANAVSDPGRYGENVLGSVVGSAVPALIGQTAGSIDPLQRQATTILDRVRARIPGLSQTLPPRRDVMGEPIAGSNGGGIAAFSPIFAGQDKNDPTLRALVDAGVQIGKPSKFYTNPDTGKREEMTPQQFDAYQAAVGRAAKPELDALVLDPEWRLMTAEDRSAEVDAIMRDAREAAQGEALNDQAVGGSLQPYVRGRKLSDAEFMAYREKVDALSAQMLSARRSTPEWIRMPMDARKAEAERIGAAARAAARDSLFPVERGALPSGFVLEGVGAH